MEPSLRADFSREQTTILPTEGFSNPRAILEAVELIPGMVVADLGAGSGAYTVAAADRVGATGKVFAVDVQKELVTKIKNEAGQKNVGHIDIIWGDIEQYQGTRIKSDSVDVAILANVLFQCEDRKGALKEALRILVNGGRLLVVDWSDSFNGMGPHETHLLREDTARLLCEEAGALFVRTVFAGAHHYGLVFQKPTTL